MRAAAALFLIASTCVGPSTMEKIGGNWLIEEPPKLPETGPRPRDLVRETAGGRVTVASFVEKFRFHDPDCVVFQTADAHDVFAVCGDRMPVRIAASSAAQWSFEADGLHRTGEADLVNGRLVEPTEHISIAAIVALAGQQPPFQEGATPAAGALVPVESERPLTVDAMRPDGNSHLIHAVVRRRADVVDALLAAGADVNARNESGATALMIAAGRGNLPMVERLLSAGADVSLKDNRGVTAVEYAEGRGETEIVRLLKSR